MKVLYCNPSFWDYRLPFFKELVRLFEGNFYVMYSPLRYKMCGKESLCCRIKEELGNNAIPIYTEHVFDTYSKKWDQMPNIERGKRIPFTKGLLRAINQVSPDVVISEGFFQWTPLVQLWGITHHKPIFIDYERTLYTERNNSILKTWMRKLQDKTIHGYLVNGTETKKYLEAIGVKASKIYISGMSADSFGLRSSIARMEREEKVILKEKYQHYSDGLLYLFCGRIEKMKGVSQLLEAWLEHILTYHHDHLLLVGIGAAYKELVQKYMDEKSISFVGHVDYKDIYRFYAISDVFILPTLQDNWSLVVPEAMACGLPVATSIYNGCHTELVHGGENGYVFDTFKKSTILKALDYFHHVNLKEQGKKSIILEKKFDVEHCAKRAFNAITRL